MVVSVSTLPDHDFDERVVAAVLAHTHARGLVIEVMHASTIPAPTTLAREGQELVVRWGARGAVWIDLVLDGTSMLYLAEPTQDRVYQRALPAAGAGSSAQAESVANVVSAVVAAIVEGQIAIGETPTGLDVVEPPPEVLARPEPQPARTVPAGPPVPAPSPPPQTDTPSWPRLRFTAGYVGSTFAAALPWQGGLAVSVGWRPTQRVHLDLGYEVLLGARVRSEFIDLTVRRHPITLAGGHTWSLGRVWDLRLGARLAVDIVERRAGRTTDEVTLSADRRQIFTSAGAVLGAGVRPAGAVRIGLAVGVEAVLSRADYAVYTPEKTTVLAPFPVRFVAAVTVDFELLRRPPTGEKKLTR